MSVMYRMVSAGSSPRMWGIRQSRPSPLPGPSVHPHACGAYLMFCNNAISKGGSSPRMWGILVFAHHIGLPHRFIPTHVGHTMEARISFSIRTGSSPRMWGILVGPTGSGKSVRFIPTHVGHTSFSRVRSRYLPGSSPRMWGIRIGLCWCDRILRFIPTHVGHTDRFFICHDHHPVHPHACGAYTRRNVVMTPFFAKKTPLCVEPV